MYLMQHLLSSQNTHASRRSCCCCYKSEWDFPENIRTPQTAFWNSEGKGGLFELELRGQGGSLNWNSEIMGDYLHSEF